MKKLLLCLMAMLVLAGCGAQGRAPSGSDETLLQAQADFESRLDAVKALLDAAELPEVISCGDAASAAACYGFREAALRDGWALSSSYALEAFEVALFHAKSEANVTIIVEKLRTYTRELEKKYALAAPATASRLRQAELITDGCFCALIVCGEELRAEIVAAINAGSSD